MRRGSLIAPFLLILVGVVFLIKNIRPDIPIFETVFTYWPFLLIGWGALRLVEIVFSYLRGNALPAAGVSGGEWALIVILTVVGSGVWGVQHFTRDGGFGRIRIGGVEVFGESFDYPLETASKPAGKTPRIVVENLRGATRIIGTDTEEVTVSGRRTIRAMERQDADKANRDSPFEFTATGEVVTVRTGLERGEGPRVTSDLEIKVPRGASVEARGRTVDYDVSDIVGEVTIECDNSGVRLQNIAGRVRVNTKASDIIRAFDLKNDIEIKGRGRDVELENIAGQVTINGAYSGETTLRKVAKPVRFESEVTEIQMAGVPGQFQLTLSNLTAEQITGPLMVKTKSKDIELTNVSDTITIDLDRGDVNVVQTRLPLAGIDVQVRTGEIEVALPQTAKFSIDAVTERGSVSNDFDSKLAEESRERGASLKGILGPGPTVKLRTNRGSIGLRKTGPADMVVPLPSTTKAPKVIKDAKEPARADNQ